MAEPLHERDPMLPQRFCNRFYNGLWQRNDFHPQDFGYLIGVLDGGECPWFHFGYIIGWDMNRTNPQSLIAILPLKRIVRLHKNPDIPNGEIDIYSDRSPLPESDQWQLSPHFLTLLGFVFQDKGEENVCWNNIYFIRNVSKIFKAIFLQKIYIKFERGREQFCAIDAGRTLGTHRSTSSAGVEQKQGE